MRKGLDVGLWSSVLDRRVVTARGHFLDILGNRLLSCPRHSRTYHGHPGRPPPGHARRPRSQGALVGPAARPRRRPRHPRLDVRHARRHRRLPVRRPAPPRGAPAGGQRVGALRQGEARPLLPAHHRRPAAAEDRDGGVAALRADRHSPPHRHHAGLTVHVPTWRRYLRFWPSDIDADLDEEFRFHVDAEMEYLTARGWTPAAAREEALRRFGDVEQYRRDGRSADERRAGREHRKENLVVLKQDLRFALRSLRRQPAFTAIAVITLALGIGANTAIFSVINAVMLTPLPYREPHRLVMLWETRPGGDRPLVSYRNFVDWRQRQRGLEDIGVYYPWASFTMTGRGDAERVDGALVSGNYLQLLGVRPALGRLVTPADDSPGSARVALLDNGFFQSRFGGDRSVLGRTLVLDGQAYTVVGVLAPDVRVSYRAGDQNPDVVLPVGLFAKDAPYNRRGQADLFAVGRLKAGVTVEQALSDLQRVSAELRTEYPGENAGLGAAGAPLMYGVVRFIKPALQILMAAVALVLLIACASVSSLVLSRSAARQREFALRTALGAARGRIVRQVLTESVVLALAGGALGVGIAVAGVRILVTLQRGAPRIADSHVNTPVLLFALGVSLLTGLLFGLAPALQSGSAQLVSALKEGGRGTSGAASLQRTRAA